MIHSLLGNPVTADPFKNEELKEIMFWETKVTIRKTEANIKIFPYFVNQNRKPIPNQQISRNAGQRMEAANVVMSYSITCLLYVKRIEIQQLKY